jgi:hypothetical protein
MKRVTPGADYDVQLTLELARVAREPTLADKQRVLEALQVRLGDLPSLSSAGESTTGVRLVVPKVTRPTLGAHAAKLARSLVSSKAAMHLLWVGAATGALGFWAGVQLTEPVELPRPVASAVRGPSEPLGPPEPPAVAEAPRPASTAAAAPRPAAVEPPKPPAPSPPPAVAPPAVAPPAVTPPARVPPPAVAPPAAPPAPVLAQPAKPAAAPPPSPPAAPVARRAHASVPAPLDDNARFFEAVRLLQRAQRALDGGELGLALVLLEELDERFPPELLSEERDAARVIALCKGGDTLRARRLAQQLAARSPSSIYAARIARSCGSFDAASTAPR